MASGDRERPTSISNINIVENNGCGSGCGSCLGVAFLLVFVYLAVGWPYLLGTWIATELGAAPDSREGALVGWLLEIVYITALVIVGVWLWRRRQQIADATRGAEQPTVFNQGQEATERLALPPDSSQSGALYCSRCGVEAVSGALYCVKCGHRLT